MASWALPCWLDQQRNTSSRTRLYVCSPERLSLAHAAIASHCKSWHTWTLSSLQIDTRTSSNSYQRWLHARHCKKPTHIFSWRQFYPPPPSLSLLYRVVRWLCLITYINLLLMRSWGWLRGSLLVRPILRKLSKSAYLKVSLIRKQIRDFVPPCSLCTSYSSLLVVSQKTNLTARWRDGETLSKSQMRSLCPTVYLFVATLLLAWLFRLTLSYLIIADVSLLITLK